MHIFVKMCDDTKPEPAETENGPICWKITSSLELQSLRHKSSDNMRSPGMLPAPAKVCRNRRLVYVKRC